MKPTILSSRIAYQGFFQVKEDQLCQNNITRAHASLILPADAAVILAKTKDDLYILNYEYRHPTGQFLLGCPGGLFEPNEDPLEAAKRELLEETGYTSNNFHLMGSAYPCPGICNQKIYYFLALNTTYQQPPTPDPGEIIETQFKTHNELISCIQTAPNIDAILCTALLYQELFT